MNKKQGMSLEEKRKLLRELLEKKASENNRFLASPGQKALWTFTKAHPHSPAYHLKFTAHVVPGIKKERLESAFSFLISRHSALRSRFVFEDNKLYQLFEKSIDFKITTKSVSPEEIHAQIIADYSKPFNLGTGPLIHCFVYKIGEHEQTLLIVIHHIVIDGVSLLNLVSELGGALNGVLLKHQDSADKPHFDYQHYLQYISQRKTTDTYAAAKAYWLKKLADTQGLLNLPYDRLRHLSPTYEGGAVIKTLSSEKITALKELASHEKITLHSLLLGIYQLLLHKISRQKRVLSVTPCLGRDKKEFFSIIGYFANMVIIDTDIKLAPSVKSFMHVCRQSLVDALEYQQIPFSVLVQNVLSLKRGATQLPLAQAAFAFHQPFTSSQSLNVELFSKEAEELHWDGATVKPFRIAPAACQFELYLVALEESNKTISLNFEFMRDVFDEETITAIANYYMELVDAVLETIEQDLYQLPEFAKFTSLEHDVERFNDTDKAIPDVTLTRLLYDCMTKNRKTIAMVDSLGEYTYEDVLKLSFGLAKKLPYSGGVQVGIGILLEKGVGQIVSLLATLWTGNYFIPINIDNPPQRIADITKQANLQYIITTKTLSLNKKLENCQIIDIETMNQENDYSIRDVQPTDLLYVIFTSGTTGIPKGVAISHRSLLNTVLSINEKFGINGEDSVFAISDLSFDLAMYDVFGMLLAGGKMVFCPQAYIKEPKEWIKWIHHYQISLWNSVPMLFSMLLEQATQELPIKHVFLSGDWISVNLVERAHERCPLAQVISLGGPTETTIWSINYPLSRNVRYDFIPYGYPLPNHRYYVLDESLSLCSYGQLGELYTSGLGLAVSYLNDEERTHQAFIEHPRFGRIYRSGDIGYLTKDVGICIKGRCDRQVKIGGYRIELDDVRTALEKCFNGFTVTCDATGHPQNKRLVGFIQAKKAMKENHQIIDNIAKDPRFCDAYSTLCETLPSYMIPDIFIQVNAFPLSRNNKIDYSRLPDVSNLTPKTRSTQVFTPVMQKMATIWADALEVPVEEITAESHFFQLGGDSLRAVTLINGVETVFSISCNLKSLFDSPIFSAFTESVLSLLTKENELKLKFQTDKSKRYEPFSLTPVQQAYWVGRQGQMDLGGIGSHSYYEFDLDELDIARFQQALDKTIARHDMLRMVITAQGHQRVLKDAPPYPLEVVNLKKEAEKKREKILNLNRETLSHEVVSMETYPTFRLKIFQFQYKHRLIISYDALQFDAWSFLIFVRDLSKCYVNPDLKEKPLSLRFRDYVQYLETLANTLVYKNAKEYWVKRLPTLPYGPELPLQTVPKRQEFNRISGSLEKEKWSVLVSKAKELSCTPTGLMLAVFSWVIKSYSRKPNFCLNLTLFNRLAVHKEIEEVIGDFTSLILFEVKEVRTSQVFANFLTRIQQQLFSDLDNRIYDGILVQRDLRRLNSECPNVIAPVVFTSTLGFEKPQLLGDLAEKKVRLNYSITQTPQVWLDNQIREDEYGVHWVWDYLIGLFTPSIIEAMHQSFEKILRELVDINWNQYVPEAILPEAKQRLIAYNDTKETPADLSLTLAVAAALERHEKTSIAIIDSQGSMSYQELDERARRFAQALKCKGYPTGSAIGVFLEKGREQVIACLAILFSGCYFVPFNLASPSRRISLLIKESRICAMISTKKLAELYQIPKALLMDINTPADNKLQCIANPSLDDIAYVIYTSGSTGIPKGVVITHLGVMNTLLDINKRFGVGVDDKILALSDLSFDLSIYDLFGLLLAGGAIVFPLVEELKEPSHWLHLIHSYRITIWNSVPMLYAMLLHAKEEIPSIKSVLLSGDWIMPEVASNGYTLCPNATLNALGGATECSIWSNHYLIEKHENYEYIPYGFPLTNQRLYILHNDLTLCPEGVEGELYIGGLGLAREYFQDEEKTKKSFIEHPEFGRLYRTGDWGMMSLEHGIKFLGRQDSQVKVGGYRIELNEIEFHLRKCLGINELVVDVEDVNHSKRLIAYCVVNDKSEDKKIQQLSHANIRHFDTTLDEIYLKKNQNSLDERFWFHRKSYRKWVKGAVDIEAIKLLLPNADKTSNPIEDEYKLTNALLSLMAIQNSSMPIPKYRYPSAGGLYPVQCYLSIESERFGISKGVYYFSPLQARLIKINHEPMLDYDALFLIADSTLIKPYYPSTWFDFCEIEAGHMAALVNHWVGIKEKSVEQFIPSMLCLSDSHVLIQSFHMCSEKVLVNSSIDLMIYDNTPNQAVYKLSHLNSKKGRWSEENVVVDISSLGENAKIVNEATCFIVFDPSASPFTIGFCTQQWMERLAENCIGSIYIGDLAITKENHTVICCGIALGKINQNMLLSKAISKTVLTKQDIINQAYTRLKNELPDYMIPSDFILLAKLPISANGKIDKNALPRKTYTAQEVKGQPISDVFEERVASVWKKTLNLSSQVIYQDSDFFVLGGDSLSALEMLALIKEKLSIQVDLKTIFNAPLFSSFCSQLRLVQMNGLIDSAELVALNAKNDQLPLIILVHPGTGTIDCFLGFAEESRGEYELVAIQYKDDKAENLYELGTYYAEQVIEKYKNRSVHILGYSLGAYIAFEMAKILEDRDFKYETLSLVDALPIKNPEEIFYESEEEINLFEKVLIEDYGVTEEKIHTLLGYINDRQNSLLKLCASYLTKGRIHGRAAYFKAREATPYLKNKFKSESVNLWDAYSSCPVSVYEIDGNHMNIFSSQHIKSFIEAYNAFLHRNRLINPTLFRHHELR